MLEGMRTGRAFGAVDAVATLTKIKAPTLVMFGRDDRVTPIDGSLAAMRLIPQCELHVFYDCGHWAMIERKDEFESTVLAFLRGMASNGAGNAARAGSRPVLAA